MPPGRFPQLRCEHGKRRPVTVPRLPNFCGLESLHLESKYRTKVSNHLKDRKSVRKLALVCGYERGKPLGVPTNFLSVRQKVQ